MAPLSIDILCKGHFLCKATLSHPLAQSLLYNQRSLRLNLCQQCRKLLLTGLFPQFVYPSLYVLTIWIEDLLVDIPGEQETGQRRVIPALPEIECTNIPQRRSLAPAIADLSSDRQSLLIIPQCFLLLAYGIVHSAQVVEGSSLAPAIADLLPNSQRLLIIP